jgi:hypothetical protein
MASRRIFIEDFLVCLLVCLLLTAVAYLFHLGDHFYVEIPIILISLVAGSSWVGHLRRHNHSI